MYLGATQDPLTGLLNRRAFQDRFLEEAAATSRHDLQACLALIDIDHFKSVNDNYGHPAGDDVLVEVARRLTSCLRTEDILARYGGEEFIVLARMTPLEGARVLLERMRQVVEATPFPVSTDKGEQSLKVTLSAGFTALVKGSTMEQAVERADGALYEAKEKGRNRVVSR
jgi:diguanylate cyclase (GGDEF)-like protein